MKNPEDSLLNKIDVLLDEALELVEEERIAYIDRMCGDNTILRRLIIPILEAEQSAPKFLDGNVLDFASSLLDEFLKESEPLYIPGIEDYELEKEVDRGGMGIVYKARHIILDRIVAIKVLKEELLDSSFRERFEQEQRVLSRLEHPNIARLYEIGLTDHDQPYFAMEYVNGLSLDSYCDHHRLSIDQRLHFFISIAEAVHFAHRNLVIHRDIKPSNILASDVDGIKLLDFGIAKLLSEEDEKSLTKTRERLLTPKYAAPEQVRGELITTATDVYQLGVVLYELLTGHLPYPTSGQSRYDIESAVCNHEPTRPSAIVNEFEEFPDSVVEPDFVAQARSSNQELLSKRLRGDLDAIVLKALRKEPEKRYTSVESFVEDVKRHLNNLPVLAQSDTFSYRSRKFIRRHRIGLSVASAFIIVLVVFHLP